MNNLNYILRNILSTKSRAKNKHKEKRWKGLSLLLEKSSKMDKRKREVAMVVVANHQPPRCWRWKL